MAPSRVFAPRGLMMIPKPNGEGERPLGIPTIRDRVVQTAAKLVFEPIFEADFEDNAYGYRPARGAVDAVKEVHRLICRGYTDVVDADLSRYFDSIPHSDLMKSVARRIVRQLRAAQSPMPWRVAVPLQFEPETFSMRRRHEAGENGRARASEHVQQRDSTICRPKRNPAARRGPCRTSSRAWLARTDCPA
jgi:Reverse transcriptase (RNA-dependent DNA polymerase)